jgi:hypothetical protein
VDDDVLHVLVTLKSETLLDSQLKLRTEPVMCGEVEIPLEDGDCATTVVVMALADADLSEDCMKFPEDDAMRIAFEELSARQADLEMRRIGIIMLARPRSPLRLRRRRSFRRFSSCRGQL